MFIITGNQNGESRKVITFNQLGIEAFLRINMAADEYAEISQYISERLVMGCTLMGWQWANGDSFEIYCPANESLPMSVEPPVVINPLRKFAQTVVSAIL